MSQNAVKCPWKNYILLPEGVEIAKDEDCKCPAACPNYKTLKASCRYAVFRARSASVAANELSAESKRYAYTAEEIAAYFPDIPSMPTATAEQPGQEKSDAESSPQATGGAARVYTFPIFQANATPDDRHEERQSDREYASTHFVPTRRYDSFELRGKYYTSDGRGGTENLSDSACVNRLYDLILRNFDMEAVFNGETVKDRFLWLLDITLPAEKRTLADRILKNSDIVRAEKFFLLFYAAIFFDKSKPLYWANTFTPRLQPTYLDKTDFYRRVAEKRDGGFYDAHIKLALLWLRRIDFSDWDNEEKVMRENLRLQENVVKEPLLDSVVFWSEQSFGGKFVCLGPKDAFVRNLAVSDKTQEELEYTAEFLSRYDIVRQGGQYRIVTRPTPDPEYSVEVEQSEVNDDVMSMLFSKGRSLSKLSLYLYILRRYCEMLHPDEVRVGSVLFQEKLYTEQIQQTVLETCAYFYGNAADERIKKESYGRAVLSKLLYKKSCLFAQSARQARSEEYMSDVLSLVSDDIVETNTVERYFSVCRELGLADKIRLYGFEYSQGLQRKKMLTLTEWICDQIRGATSISRLCGDVLGSAIFKAYRKVFETNSNGAKQAHDLFAIYQAHETDIQRAVDAYNGRK